MPETIDAPPYISVLDQLQVTPALSEAPPAKPEPTEEKPEPTEKPEKKDEPAKPEAKGARTPSSPKGEENFKTVMEARKAAEKRAADMEEKAKQLEQKLAEQERQLAELPQTKESAAKLEAQIREKEEALERMNSEFERLKEESKAANLQRDPEFIDRFVKPRDFQVAQLRDMALGTKTMSEPDIMRAVRDRNFEKLSEIREQLPPHQTYRWDAILQKIEAIDLEKEQALADADKTYEQITESRRQLAMKSHKERLEAHRSIGAKIINDLREIPFVREDKELQQQISEIAEGVAGGKGGESWTPEKIIGSAVAVPVLTKVNAAQASIIDDQKAKLEENAKALEELQKKLDERDEFIKSKYGSLDFRPQSPAARGGNGEYDPDKPIHEQITVRR